MKINIESIPHKAHRYPTCGDWWIDKDGTWQIRVSNLSDWRMELLVAIHELVEMSLCEAFCVSEIEVTNFDKLFESERESGQHGNAEPGDDCRAPYRKYHFTATNIERILSESLVVDWNKYEDEIKRL